MVILRSNGAGNNPKLALNVSKSNDFSSNIWVKYAGRQILFKNIAILLSASFPLEIEFSCMSITDK